MTQTDKNTPATATTSKRVTKAKTTTAKVATVLTSADAAVNQEKTSSQTELQGMQSDTAGQNLVADVESVNMAGMPEAQREAYKHELEGILSDTAGQNLVADVEPEKSSSAEISASPVNKPVGTEQVLFWDQSAQYQSAAAAVQVGEKNDVVLTDEASSVELINEVLPEVQSPSPVKRATAVKTGLFVVVKNTGVQTVFEPLSKTSIKSGETVEIRCSTGQFKHDVLNNLKQFIGLGKNLEIQNA